MCYIIKYNQQYLSKDCRFVDTVENVMTFVSEDDAKNKIENSIAKKIRNDVEIVKTYIDKTERLNQIVECPKTNYSNFISLQKNVRNLSIELLDILEKGQKLSTELSTVEAEICDIYHFLELKGCKSAKESKKITDLLQTKLRQRREIKDKLGLFQMLQDKEDLLNGLLSVSNYIDNLDTRTYRVRKIDELFTNETDEK